MPAIVLQEYVEVGMANAVALSLDLSEVTAKIFRSLTNRGGGEYEGQSATDVFGRPWF